MLITEEVDLTDDWKKRVDGQYLVVLGPIEFELCTLGYNEPDEYFFYNENIDCLKLDDETIKAIYELTWINK